jgi:2-polyprenyl-6-hydroxyphenyl methylase/3-demethylubiquinone-9 3-methyltransferase
MNPTTSQPYPSVPGGSASAAEVARFDALADRWWDPDGPMRPLHRMNATRSRWVADRIAETFGSDARPRILDVGCGAGLLAEALARRGFPVLGLDAAPDVIAAAAAHAAGTGLDVSYRVAAAESLLGEPDRFAVITALEVIEHVVEPVAFLRTLGRLVRPDGLLILSTLDRSMVSYLTAKVGAEYLLRWLPVGTHSWRQFLRPTELARALRTTGWRPGKVAGLVPAAGAIGWRVTERPMVNYIMVAHR